jgi:hypothetical protein
MYGDADRAALARYEKRKAKSNKRKSVKLFSVDET